MLTFIRGAGTFIGAGQIYVKLLPDGEPVQLTNDDLMKISPVFSPDGSRVAYTAVGTDSSWQEAWNTWAVPVLRGAPQQMLPNASGLTWIDAQHVMFSEITKGIYMKLVTSTETRAEQRDVYLPAAPETGMAHRSSLSPNHKWVLVIEMSNGGWQPCRLVPFEGGSPGKEVGPPAARCLSAAWSPDGNWMYFSADTGTGFHLWRQGFPDGAPEQLTSGVTQEEGVAVSPDGRSLVTAVGAEQSTVWLHDRNGDRQVSSQGFAFSPLLSADGRKIYYLVRNFVSSARWVGELRMADVVTGRSERILPGFSISRYDISRDGKRIVFAADDAAGKSAVWVAFLDRHVAPQQVRLPSEAYRPFFGPDGRIILFRRAGQSNYVYRMRSDGTGQERIIPDPVIYLLGVSPDGQWAVAWVARKDKEGRQAVVAYPIDGGASRLICSSCDADDSYYQAASLLSWAPDQRFLYLRSKLAGMDSVRTFSLPLQPGAALPKLPAAGITSEDELLASLGGKVVDRRAVYPGSDPSTYAFTRVTTQRNIYRLQLN
jgi:Tol biopolymer transport system component